MADSPDATAIDAVFDDMVDRRRAIHRRPELSFAEHATTALIRDHMAALDIGEADRVTETGGIFVMDGGRPGRIPLRRGGEAQGALRGSRVQASRPGGEAVASRRSLEIGRWPGREVRR